MTDRTAEPRTGRPPGFERAKAVESAMNLFWKRGYLDVSAKDLAEAMAIQRSSFYNSFNSRADVFREALALYGSIAPDAALDQVQPGEPVIPAIQSVLATVCKVRAADPEARGCLICNSVAELVGVDEEVGPLIAAIIDRRIAGMERLLRQAVDQGEIPAPADPRGAAISFINFLLGFNLMAKVVADEAQLRAGCRHFLMSLGVPDPLRG
jgi:TetR/AcrR family transcriptional regulator, transcriptional repressor for nem operon